MERPTRHQDLDNFFGSAADELDGGGLKGLLHEKDRPGGILGLFETMSKLHSDTGNNFSVTRQQAAGAQREDDRQPQTVRGWLIDFLLLFSELGASLFQIAKSLIAN